MALKLYRLASKAFPIFDGTGAALNGARWNTRGVAVIYSASSLAGAKLELLAHIGFKALPKNFGYVEIVVPDGIAVETFPRRTVPSLNESTAWGDDWIGKRRTLLARVPSKASPGEFNYLINPLHGDLKLLKISSEKAARWDARHFRR